MVLKSAINACRSGGARPSVPMDARSAEAADRGSRKPLTMVGRHDTLSAMQKCAKVSAMCAPVRPALP